MEAALSLFDLQTFTYTRTAGRTMSTTTGKWSAGTATTTSATGNIQPAGDKDLQMLPEGERTFESIVVVTDTALAVGDVVAYGSVNYKVLVVENYAGGASIIGIKAHYQAICTKKKE